MIEYTAILLNFAAALCFLSPEQKIPPDKVTWYYDVGWGKMESIKRSKRNFNVAGVIFLGLGLSCQIVAVLKLL